MIERVRVTGAEVGRMLGRDVRVSDREKERFIYLGKWWLEYRCHICKRQRQTQHDHSDAKSIKDPDIRRVQEYLGRKADLFGQCHRSFDLVLLIKGEHEKETDLRHSEQYWG